MSGGALVKYGTDYIYKAEFSVAETNNMINMARAVCGEDCLIANVFDFLMVIGISLRKECDERKCNYEDYGIVWNRRCNG